MNPVARARALVPGRGERTDLGFSVLLAVLAVVGFDSSFGGQEAYTVGIPAVVVGAAVGYLLARLRPPLLVGAAIGTAGFFVFGGAVALRSDAVAGVLPGPDVWSGLVDGTVNGWARLLTTVPPAGEAGNLLAIPYLAGYAGGLLAVVLALLVRHWPLCIVPPVGVLALAVLFGVDEPASLLLQGAVFGAATVAWLCLREDRRSRPVITHGSAMRVAGSGALLAVAVLGAFVLAPRLPWADANERFVLRDHVNPPFDPSQYPSPLSRYRAFDGKDPIEGTLLEVEGLPKDAVVRFAVMDTYDGFVWRASPPGPGPGGTYQRVGDRIPGATSGEQATVTFTMGSLADRDSVWIPTAGSPTALRFTGSAADALTESFRFNRATETAATSRALQEGDTWQVDATFADPPPEEDLQQRSAAYTPPIPEGLAENKDLTDQLAAWTEGARSPYEKVQKLILSLIEVGAYNNGSVQPIASGHSLYRLKRFITTSQPQGNGEQYAAAVAYLAEAMQIPARVVLEFTADGPGPTKVQADDIRASVEIDLDGVGWVRVADPTPPKDDEPEPQHQQEEPKPVNQVQPPPPTTLPPPLELPEEPDREAVKTDKAEADAGASGMLAAVLRAAGLASIPVVVLVGPALAVIALKARRRKRRRTRGAPAARIAGGWREVTDLARDMGHPVPPKATRREVARFAAPAAGGLAEHIDASVFGHAAPDDTVATSVWERVDEVRRAMTAERSRKDRIRAAVSLTSLRAGR